ncbi:MAG TPA: SBBP repeat-containing protein [Chitinophagaceae bacterium]|nr:SBBP repeat-containing protein [Chitinophagaceae bacterium]
MRKWFLLFILKGLVVDAGAQALYFNWAKQLAGAGDKTAHSIAVDSSGNVYTTGYFSGTIDFDPGPGVFNMVAPAPTVFICKLNANGDFVWARQMTGTRSESFTVALDAVGNIYVSGYFYGTVDFDPGPANLFITSFGETDVFVSKLDPSGNLFWVKQVGGTCGEIGNSMAVDALGNVVVTGEFCGTVDFDPGPNAYNLTFANGSDAFAFKLDATGNFGWARKWGTGRASNRGQAIAIDGSANVIVTGIYFGAMDMDPGPGTYTLTSSGNTSFDIFVVKLDVMGNFQWARSLGSPGTEYPRAVAVDASLDIYIAGVFFDVADFDPGGTSFELTTAGAVDVFVCKLNSSGNFIWAKQLGGAGGDVCNSLTLDKNNNPYVIGSFAGNADFDPGPATYTMTASSSDIFISKLDPSGNFVWAKQLGGSLEDQGYEIAVDARANVYTTGLFSGSADFDPDAGVYVLNSVGEKDIVVHKLGPCVNNLTTNLVAAACRSYTLNNQTYSSSGVYTQRLVDSRGCDSMVSLDLTILPSASSTISKTICAGQSYNGHSAAGEYADTLVAANGCDSISILQLTVLARPSPYLGVDTFFCSGDSLELFPGRFDSYTWQDGSSNNSFVVRQPGLYSVVVTNQCDRGEDAILIQEQTCDLYFPSAFTPNNDGRNDQFKILNGYHLKDFQLEIFNRWGQKVFHTNDAGRGWNGLFRGMQAETGVYVWHCRFEKAGIPNYRKGTVLLIK